MRYVLAIGFLVMAPGLLSDNVKIGEFLELPASEQYRILTASYRTATTLLAFGGVGFGESKLAPEKMATCLHERDAKWLRETLSEYIRTYPSMATDFGPAFAQSMAWKCRIKGSESLKLLAGAFQAL